KPATIGTAIAATRSGNFQGATTQDCHARPPSAPASVDQVPFIVAIVGDTRAGALMMRIFTTPRCISEMPRCTFWNASAARSAARCRITLIRLINQSQCTRSARLNGLLITGIDFLEPLGLECLNRPQTLLTTEGSPPMPRTRQKDDVE